MEIIISPWDSAVSKAVNKIKSVDANLLKNVKKIVIHPGGGSGQLGFVEMGPGKDPQVIHLFKDRIKENVFKNANKTEATKETLSLGELENAIVDALVQVIAHESTHIGKNRTQEQIEKGPFLGEAEAERGAKEIMQKIKPANKKFNISKRAKFI